MSGCAAPPQPTSKADFRYVVQIEEKSGEKLLATNRSGMIWRTVLRSNGGDASLRVALLDGADSTDSSCVVPGPLLLGSYGNAVVINLDAGCQILGLSKNGSSSLEIIVLSMAPRVIQRP